MFELSRLPYDSLEPYISSKLLDRHYNGHHKAYVDALNGLVSGTEFEGMSNECLEGIVKKSHGSSRAIFNNASQIWNHDFYWKSMKHDGGGDPTGKFAEMVISNFGSIEGLKTAFTTSGTAHFGSGWVWLIYNTSNKSLSIVSTANADSPLLTEGQYPLLTMDVWEHAYYLDYMNVRKEYIRVFLEHLVNWDFAASRLEAIGVL